jgi:hypothetical protein
MVMQFEDVIRGRRGAPVRSRGLLHGILPGAAENAEKKTARARAWAGLDDTVTRVS